MLQCSMPAGGNYLNLNYLYPVGLKKSRHFNLIYGEHTPLSCLKSFLPVVCCVVCCTAFRLLSVSPCFSNRKVFYTFILHIWSFHRILLDPTRPVYIYFSFAFLFSLQNYFHSHNHLYTFCLLISQAQLYFLELSKDFYLPLYELSWLVKH